MAAVLTIRPLTLLLAGVAVGFHFSLAMPSLAFALHGSNEPVLRGDGSVDTAATLEAAIRWSAGPGPNGSGLHDGLQVGVQAGFAAAMGADDATETANYRQAISNAFGFWESPALEFDITFDSPALGPEIFLTFADSSHQLFSGTGFAGIGFTLFEFDANRTLTNGVASPGMSSWRGVLVINTDFMSERSTGLNHPQSVANLGSLMAHEVGHVIGLGHPDEQRNFDTDGNPNTPVLIDPTDPFGGFMETLTFSPNDVMADPYAFGRPQADDLAGRDVLYLVPEPGLAALLLFAGVMHHRTRR